MSLVLGNCQFFLRLVTELLFQEKEKKDLDLFLLVCRIPCFLE